MERRQFVNEIVVVIQGNSGRYPFVSAIRFLAAVIPLTEAFDV